MKTRTLTTVLLVILFSSVNAQDFREQFKNLMSKKDTAAQQNLLDSWRTAKPDDPELYVAFYNYYVVKSKKDVLSLDQHPKGKESLQMNDPDTKEAVGYINDGTFYEPGLLQAGFAYIDTGITKFPDRLDMRFGKVYMLGEVTDYENFTKEILKTLDRSNVIKNKWTWTNNEPVENAEKFMLGNMQHYIVQLYNTEDDSLVENIKQISERVLKYYPGHVESLSNLSLVHMIRKDFDKALVPLLKAEKLSPSDPIVLSNIAHCYTQKGDNKNAIKYYELTVQYGSDNTRKFANEKLAELRKK
jgi:tetratricopeptide (TPR) repeat protein